MSIHSIGNRILFLIGSAVMVGLCAMMFFFLRQQEQAILAQNERTMGLLATSVSQTLQTVMLSGNAEVAEDFAANLTATPGIIDFRILRVNGVEAFHDNETINAVNSRLGDEAFHIKSNPKPPNKVLSDTKRSTVHSGLFAKGYVADYAMDENSGVSSVTFWAPIHSGEECAACHGENERLRGILKLTTSLVPVQNDIAHAKMQGILLLVVSLGVIILLLLLVVNRSVVAPINRVSNAMGDVTNGDWNSKVPEDGKDELSRMGQIFNTMTNELQRTYSGLQSERNKLTTIILSAKEGIVVTNPLGEVVLVNPAAERLLGKSDQQIVKEGFINLLDDPDYVQNYLDTNGLEMPDTIVYNSRVLNFYACSIKNDDGSERIGSAALIRDVTDEKKLERQLRELSTTDALTGLLNRRRLDEVLAEELNRAKRYHMQLGLLIFDVDHFKRFNDEHGHDQGDRVLQAIAAEMKDHFRNIDFPCRYGGEEFVAILPNTYPEGAIKVADRLRERIEEMVVDGLKVTISIGVAVYPQSPGDEPDTLLKSADNALYRAKRSGRNRVIFADINDAPEEE
ncbi:sensor domain-containing diguanylate cyclase [Magnetofaba australis]|nr:diguanylate cyclase [Magnetofaba australis]